MTARGRVLSATDLGAGAVLYETVSLRRGDTPHTRTGDGPTVAAAGILLSVAWLLESKRLKFSS